MYNNLKIMVNNLVLYIKKIIKIIKRPVDQVKNKNRCRNIEKIELELLQYRKYMNEPENYKEKIREESEIAEWLGQDSFTIKPLTPEEERRLEYLLTIYNNNK